MEGVYIDLGAANHPERGSEAAESKDTSRMWYVYILECKNKSLYTGITNNLQRRLKKHKAGKGGKFTRAFIANNFLYSEPQATKSGALKREAQIKKWTRKEKLALIDKDCS